MKKDIYDLLNDGDFNEDSYKDIKKEKFDDIQVQKIVSYVKKDSKKGRNNKIYAITVAAGIILAGMCFSGAGGQVMAEIKEKFNPEKNYSTDYAQELNNVDSKSGVEVKLDECERSLYNVKLRYTMNFAGGVPEYLKTKAENERKLEFVGADTYNYSLSKISDNCKIFINGRLIDKNFEYLNDMSDTGIVDLTNVEVTEKSITKELNIGIMKSVIDKDINIKIVYDKMTDNKGNVLEGPWTIEHTFKPESNEKQAEIIKMDKAYSHSFPDGSVISFDSFSNTNTGIKIYGNVKEGSGFHAYMLRGVDNLERRVIIAPLFSGAQPGITEYGVIFSSISYGENNAWKLDDNTTEIKFKLYNREDNENKYYPVEDEFTMKVR